MRNYIERRRGSEKGFTLIELLVVIVILGILAAVVVFAVGGLTDKGEESSCKTDTKVLRTAQEAFFSQEDLGTADINDYAADSDALVDAELLANPAKYHETTGVDSDADGDLDEYTITVTDGKCGETDATGGANLVDADHPDNF